jgi:hypothetical protein
MLNHATMSQFSHDQLRTIFSPFGSVIKVYKWNDPNRGDVGRVRFNSEEAVRAALKDKDAIYTTHGLMCREYIRL